MFLPSFNTVHGNIHNIPALFLNLGVQQRTKQAKLLPFQTVSVLMRQANKKVQPYTYDIVEMSAIKENRVVSRVRW